MALNLPELPVANSAAVLLSPCALDALDVSVIHVARPNVLLVGPNATTLEIVDALAPFLKSPVFRTSGRVMTLPPRTCNTLVLHGVEQVNDDDQQRLNRWLSDPDTDAQVIATTTVPLFPRVKEGLFLDALYYRLNTMCFMVESGASVTD
jgi:hypothetical protein